jgi:hypothetical protein
VHRFEPSFSSANTITGPASKCLVPVLDFLAQLPEGLNANEVLAELALTALQQLDGHAFPGHDTLAALMHCSRATAKRTVHELAKKGRVRISDDYAPDGRQLSNRYALVSAGVWGGIRVVRDRSKKGRGEGVNLTRGEGVNLTPDLKRSADLNSPLDPRETKAAASADAAAAPRTSFEVSESEVAQLASALAARHGEQALEAARAVARDERVSRAEAQLALAALLALSSVKKSIGAAFRGLCRKAKRGELGDVALRIEAERAKRAREAAQQAEEQAKRAASEAAARRADEERRAGAALPARVTEVLERIKRENAAAAEAQRARSLSFFGDDLAKPVTDGHFSRAAP